MLVQQILNSKTDQSVISVTPESAVDGILSERDIVRELGKRGTGCLDEPVSGMMTKNLITCAPGDSADAVLGMMTNGRMIGLISIGDVVKARLSELSMEKDALEGMIMGH